MSRVIKAAIWEDKPWLIEVPPPKIEEVPPPKEEPEQIEADDASEKKSSDKEELDYALWIAMKNDAENMRIEAENLLAAAKQEAAAIFSRTREEVDEERQKAEEEITKTRQLAEQEAAEIVEKAVNEAEAMKGEAEQIKAESETAAAEIRKAAWVEGRQEGYDAGLKEGKEQGYAELHQVIADANAKAEKTMRDAEEEKEKFVQEAEEEIVRVIFHAIDKILPQHFIDAPQIILPLVKKSLLKIKDQAKVIVHVSPEHYDLVLLARSELQTELEGNATLEVVSDESLKLGDVILETPNGDVDARLETQMELVKKAVQDVML